jgi:hypothetical protein
MNISIDSSIYLSLTFYTRSNSEMKLTKKNRKNELTV